MPPLPAVARDGGPKPLPPCEALAQPAACRMQLDLPGGAGGLTYYIAPPPGGATPDTALLVMHGYPRDAGHSLAAGLAAMQTAGLARRALVVAPLFQVVDQDAPRCHTPGEPAAQPGEARWRCGSWQAGGRSAGPHPITSFAAMDALVASLARQWPGLRRITLAGFSAGAQVLQHYAGFAADAPPGVALRYVIASPGSWLYFDPVRPRWTRDGRTVADPSTCPGDAHAADGCAIAMTTPDAASCEDYDDWKYGVDELPPALGRDAAAARERYRRADIAYLVGDGDSGEGRGTAARALDRHCAALLQGPYRRQRAQAYAAYDRAVLRPTRPRPLVVVPGCAHDVACVLPSAAARAALVESAGAN